jgi:hypothetical protein
MKLVAATGIDAASESLGHADLTTPRIYGHRDQTGLEVAMDAYAKWLERPTDGRKCSPDA